MEPTSAELIRAGRVNDAIEALSREIRQQPAESHLRIFLFQLNCVAGRLDKALTQLEALASLDAESALLAQIFRPVIAGEFLRREVFAGKRAPLIFGEPEAWIGLLVQAGSFLAQGQSEDAAKLRRQAFDDAPAHRGRLDGRPFEWVADADSRLGPLLEVILDGKYYWIPFGRIAQVQIEAPTDLRDLVWVPARFSWSTGGAASGHIPARYPSTEDAEDDALRLSRKTTWQEASPDCYLGLGQRVLATDTGEYPLLDCRQLEAESLT